MTARSEPVVRVAATTDLPAVVDTVVAAFDRDPAFRWFFADPDRFDEHARAFVTALLGPRLRAGAVWVVDDAAAVAAWAPPRAGHADPGDADPSDADPSDADPSDAGPSDADPGDAVPADVRDRLHRWDDAAHRFLPDEPHWYLGLLATRPARAGEGLARLAVAPGLAAARAAGLGAWLETASAANVAMYQRRGWTVVGAVDLDGVTCTVLRTD